MLPWFSATVLVILLSQWARRGAVAQFTTACLSNNNRTDDDGQPTETNADCQPAVLPRGEIAAACEANALLPIVDDPDLGNFGQCFFENTTRRLLKEQQTDALTTDEETAGDVSASGENQSIICGEPSVVEDGNITAAALGTAALGSCPSDKPICARTSDSRFCYCIEEEVGLFGDVANFSRGDVSLVLGVVSGQPSSLCFPAELDPCFNAVNRFAVPFDCAGSLPVVERREDIGPDAREQSFMPNDPPPVPQESTFAQLVPGTYLFEDVSSDAYLDTIGNTGTNVSSCMRIQGKSDDDSGLDDFFLDLSCNTTEGVSITLQFTCPETGLCSNRAGNALQPAVATIQGVLQVEQASNPACEGIEAQIEVTLTGFVDESESLIAQQFEYDTNQRILIFGNETQDDLVTARAIGILSPAANTSLGLLTFPDDVPDECDVLLNQRVFTVTSGQTEAGGILALAASGFGRNLTNGGDIRKNPLEISQYAVENRDAFRECSDLCDEVEEERSFVFLGPDRRRALLGEVLPTIFFPIYQPEQSPDLSFSSFFIGDSFFTETTLKTTACSGDERFNRSTKKVSALCAEALDPERPRSFELFDPETGVSLDFFLKGQLGNLIDGREVLANCRGPRLQDLPVGVHPGRNAPFRSQILNFGRGFDLIGETVGVALAPGAGVLGNDTCVRANLEGRHTCADIEEGGGQSLNITIQLLQGDDLDTSRCIGPAQELLENARLCKIGFECFEACPEVNLTAPSTAQPSSYFLTDPPAEDVNGTDVSYCLEIENTPGAEDFRALFSCDPDEEGVGLQVQIKYDVAELDGRVAPILDETTGELETVDFANVDFKGAVRQVFPEECNGTLMFVEGTLVGGLLFQLSPDEEPLDGRYLPTVTRFEKAPEILFTSSAPLGTMEYVIVQGLDPRFVDDIPAECFNLTQKLTHIKRARVESIDDPTAFAFNVPGVEVHELTDEGETAGVLEVVTRSPRIRVYEEQREEGTVPNSFLSEIRGPLREVCGIKEIDSTGIAVQIQCLPREPFEVTAGEPGLRLTREQIDSIAQVVTNDGSTPRLQSPAGYRLNCSCDDLERIKNETNGGDGFIVRTVPLFVDTGVEEEEVEQLCPVLIRCEPPTGTDTAGCDAIDQEMSSVSSRDALLVEDIPEECFNLTQKLIHRKRARTTVQEDGDVRTAFAFNVPQVEVHELTDEGEPTGVLEVVTRSPRIRVYEEQREEGTVPNSFLSEIRGPLREVCEIKEIDSTGIAVQIQCLPREPFEVTAGEPGLRLTREQIDSIAQVVTNDGSTPRLQSPAGYRLNCSCDDLERIKNETNGGDGFIVRTVPLFVDTGVEEEEVEQLCPVLIRCEPPTGTDTAGCDAIDHPYY
ncbi:unnamed protein product [Vitrella brassicaformis CCMP3155]|uniref:Thyroglobulin type-1 domain-containing protein n=1 Tax=Vitrella brassicaformis (strain CCMP3155) TaxID=1169540 RepID=A0A0G4ELI4_VITBC|nr:unnamed protein product [Vitrella brassicaformis CCMP3155]|eukprot:CEL97869.1 unnamed protein product [Vitrella brassicaformis CCMP3155]